MILEFEYLLEKISTEHPCGMDCSFSNEFLSIKNARIQDDPLLDQGEWVAEPKQADWAFVEIKSIELLTEQTKDIRLYTWLIEAWSHLYGFEGIARGLELCHRSLMQYWLQLHPEIEEDDLDQRLGLLEGFIAQLPGLIRQIPLIQQSPFYSLKDYDNFLYQQNQKRKHQVDEIEEREGSEQQLEKFEQLLLNTPKEVQQQNNQYVLEIQYQWQQFKSVLDELLGIDGPSFAATDAQLESIFSNIQRIYKKDTTTSKSAPPTLADNQLAQSLAQNEKNLFSGQILPAFQQSIQFNNQYHIVNREQAMQILKDIADYFQVNEPHSPVSYMLQKTIKWSQMPLHEWLAQVIKNENPLEHLHELLGVPAQNESSSEW